MIALETGFQRKSNGTLPPFGDTDGTVADGYVAFLNENV